jgi:BatD DUF11 like domain
MSAVRHALSFATHLLRSNGALRGFGVRLVLSVWLTLMAVSWSQVAVAQPNVQLNASGDAVEQGDAIQIQLSVGGAEEAPSNPRLTAPPGFVVVGPSVGTSQQISVGSGGFQRSVGMTATWRVNATKLGEFVIGPASVTVDGKVWHSNPITVRVVAKGTLPRRPQRRGPPSIFDDDFFQGFGRPGRSLFDDILQADEPPAPALPSEYQIDVAPDPYAFLRATALPQSVVIGQQVTFRVYAYGALGRFNENNSHEARKADFFAVPLGDSNRPTPFYRVRVGDRDFVATKIRDVALFPLKAGKLEIGPMSIAFYGSRYASGAHPEGLERATQPIFIDVQEPPSAGRPIGYQVGNVGRFELSAVVAPRQVAAGDSISVVATLRGQGQLPARLSTPDQRNVEWLEPSIQEQIKADDSGRLGGTRVFTYVVKLEQAGKVDLGTLALDYYDPERSAYQTARVNLGEITVSPAAAMTATAGGSPSTPKEHSLLDGTQVQKQLAPARAPQNFVADTRGFWLLLALLPALSVVLQVSGRRLQRFRSERRSQHASPAHIANDSLKQAATELRAGDESRAISHLERALFSALDSATGLKSRGFVRADLRAALENKQLPAELAQASVDLLARLEDARFTGASGAATLLEQARPLVKKVLNHAA